MSSQTAWGNLLSFCWTDLVSSCLLLSYLFTQRSELFSEKKEVSLYSGHLLTWNSKLVDQRISIYKVSSHLYCINIYIPDLLPITQGHWQKREWIPWVPLSYLLDPNPIAFLPFYILEYQFDWMFYFKIFYILNIIFKVGGFQNDILYIFSFYWLSCTSTPGLFLSSCDAFPTESFIPYIPPSTLFYFSTSLLKASCTTPEIPPAFLVSWPLHTYFFSIRKHTSTRDFVLCLDLLSNDSHMDEVSAFQGTWTLPR